MKTKIYTADLLQALTKAATTIPAKSIMPIIECFLFEFIDNTLNIHTTDLETYFSTSIKIKTPLHGKVAVPNKIIITTLKNIKEDEIILDFNTDTHKLTIKTTSGSYNITTQHGDDFPSPKHLFPTNTNIIPANILLKALNTVSPAVSTDPFKIAMSGIFIELEESSTTFTATDAYRLTTYKHTHQNQTPFSFIASPNLIKILNTCANQDSLITIGITDNSYIIQTENTTVSFRLIDQKFPNYKTVIPQNHPNKFSLNNSDLISAIRSVLAYTNQNTHIANLDFDDDTLTLQAEDTEFSNEAVINTSITPIEGSKTDINVNIRNLVETLTPIKNNLIEAHLKDDNTAMLLKHMEEDATTTILIMPVHKNKS